MLNICTMELGFFIVIIFHEIIICAESQITARIKWYPGIAAAFAFEMKLDLWLVLGIQSWEKD